MEDGCGIFGCVSTNPWPSKLDIPGVIVTGLMGVQHRGQESAGIVTSYGEDAYNIKQHKGMGLISQVFNQSLEFLQGNLGLGHTRYSTSGSSNIINCQPFVVETLEGRISLAHNGELVNANKLKQHILKHGTGLSTGSDTELIAQILSHPSKEEESGDHIWVSRIKHLNSFSPISYSLVIMFKDKLYAIRDPFGNRPLCLGQLNSSKFQSSYGDPENEGWVVSSESCSFTSVLATFYRSILPGEIVEISSSGVKSLCIIERPDQKPNAFCIFEYVYFAREDSIFEGQLVHEVRVRCGMRLAKEAPVKADLVSTVPESATPAALGYARQSGIPYAEVLCKNRYVGRTFIKPCNKSRQSAISLKFGVLSENVIGMKIVLIDDSIVRGNTISPIIQLLKNSGALEVHVRIASPPIKHPCFMGINIPTPDELIANKMDSDQLAPFIGADSVKYISLEGLIEAVNTKEEENSEGGYCTACLTGVYPIPIE